MKTAKTVWIDGIKFDSKAEGRRYVDLKIMLQAGVIRDLACHTTYPLQEGFNLPNGRRVRPITWTDDFSYYDLEKQEHVVEDVKGHQKEANKLRHKLFMFKYQQEVVLLKNY